MKEKGVVVKKRERKRERDPSYVLLRAFIIVEVYGEVEKPNATTEMSFNE